MYKDDGFEIKSGSLPCMKIELYILVSRPFMNQKQFEILLDLS